MYVARAGRHVIVLTNGKSAATAAALHRPVRRRRRGPARDRVLERRQEALRRLHRPDRRHSHRRVHDGGQRRRTPRPAAQLLAIPHHTSRTTTAAISWSGPTTCSTSASATAAAAATRCTTRQNTDVLLGKILRIDPDPSGTAAVHDPADNPFVGQAGKRGEIWMYGLRNPWRFSFDRQTDDMWIGDVGQDLYEEVDYAPRRARRASTGVGTCARAFHPYNGGAKPPGAARSRFSNGRTPPVTAPSSAATCTAAPRSRLLRRVRVRRRVHRRAARGRAEERQGRAGQGSPPERRRAHVVRPRTVRRALRGLHRRHRSTLLVPG